MFKRILDCWHSFDIYCIFVVFWDLTSANPYDIIVLIADVSTARFCNPRSTKIVNRDWTKSNPCVGKIPDKISI